MEGIQDKVAPDFKHLILVWAFAESGIGGLLHALKLPFTGIFVGGIAIMCIALIGYFQDAKNNKILEALAIVLLVKLAISPHSPWQAYVAVVFQGYLGYWLFRSKKHFKSKVLLFSVCCMLESALQKVLITFLIFGSSFLKSIDAAANSIFKAINLDIDTSLVLTGFGIYVILHLITGVVIGLWVPNIPIMINTLKMDKPIIFSNLDSEVQYSYKKKHTWWTGLFFMFLILALIATFVPDIPKLHLFWFLFRTLAISFILILVVSPIIRSFISKKYHGQKIDKSLFDETIHKIPIFSGKAFSLLKSVNQHFTGIEKWKYLIVGLLVVAMDSDKK